ncbi:paraslipin [Pseudomonas oryzihabitans]|uniref:paraslipin n=1 Tax=Pseudomonas oryzihabitans TaxID=47885 RepID=UPI0039174FFE
MDRRAPRQVPHHPQARPEFPGPLRDQVGYRLSTKDLILDVQQQEVITRDNAMILANALCFAKIVDPAKAAYGVEDYAQAITSLAMASLRAIIGEMELDQALSSRTRSRRGCG